MMSAKEKGRYGSTAGFTLMEFLLVITIFGVVLAVVLPRALRASHEAKFSNVRQAASEIASYMTQWAENQIGAQREDSNATIKDFFMEDLSRAEVGFKSDKLINKYTGDPDFNGVEMLITPERMQKNPFNGVSYFSETNNDRGAVPSRKPGLLYLVSAVDPAYGKRNFRNFYLIFTGVSGSVFRPSMRDWSKEEQPDAQPVSSRALPNLRGTWYGQQDDKDEDGIRQGIFVARVADSEQQPTDRRSEKRRDR